MRSERSSTVFRSARFTRSAAVILAIGVALSSRALADDGPIYHPDCNDPDAHEIACLEPTPEIIQHAHDNGYEYYIGHAEPTVLFFSTAGLSGNNMRWKFQLPATDPAPMQDGSSVANFELYIAFWMGLALCDPNSKPYGPCVANSDANDPSTAGAAFLELQFFPPGISGSNTQWSALLHINTLQDRNSTQINNCNEPTTAARITTNGNPAGPRLFMSNGDTIVVTIQDTSSGMQATVNDQTSASTGTMVASGANGFLHNANLTDCTTTAFDFHPMYATASPGQTVPWASLHPNVSFDFEIGHYELCGDAACATLPDGGDADSAPGTCSKTTSQTCNSDSNCPSGETCSNGCTTRRGIGGCFGSDNDKDGICYNANWPDGTPAHPASLILGSADDKGVGPLSTSTTSPGDYDEGYKTIAFRTTESTSTTFYPFWSQAGTGSACKFNFGNDIPSMTTDDFGKAAQYGTSRDNPCMPGTPPVAICQNVTVPTDANVCTAASASIDNGSNDADGDPVTLSPSPAGPYALGTTGVTLTVTEPEGMSSTCSANVTVVDTQPPSISCPSPVAECTGPSGAVVTFSAAVSDNCPGVTDLGCVPPSGSTFPLGPTPITCSVRDGSGNTSSCASTVVVQDTIPPTITASLSPDTLWPPNHKMVDIAATVAVTDICDAHPTFVLTSVVSSEPDNGLGDGDTANDIQGAILGTPDVFFQLRSERSGGGPGRTYTAVYTGSDHSGNSSTASDTVDVPKDAPGHASGGKGFAATGTQLDPRAISFQLVILSGVGADPSGIVATAQIGTTAGTIAPSRVLRYDANHDGIADTVFEFAVKDALALQLKSGPGNPLAYRYVTQDGVGYLVPNIFALGMPITP